MAKTVLKGGVYVTMPDEFGGGGGEGAVRYDEAQTLTDVQKAQARSNIGAASELEPAYTAENYASVITALNAAAKQEFTVGRTIYVRTTNVPDLWVYKNDNETSVPYTYTTDDAFIAAVNAGQGELQIGYHTVAFHEGPKVDLSEYLKKEQQTLTIPEQEQVRANIGAAKEMTVKNAIDNTLEDKTKYILGGLSSLSSALPVSGDMIQIIFTASSAFTPVISGTYVGDTIVECVSGKTYEYLFSWNGASWVLSILYY